MNIYLLERTEDIGYDEADGFVVAAVGVAKARALAGEGSGDEGAGPWLEPGQSTCRKIGEGTVKPGVVLRSYNAG